MQTIVFKVSVCETLKAAVCLSLKMTWTISCYAIYQNVFLSFHLVILCFILQGHSVLYTQWTPFSTIDTNAVRHFALNHNCGSHFFPRLSFCISFCYWKKQESCSSQEDRGPKRTGPIQPKTAAPSYALQCVVWWNRWIWTFQLVRSGQ